MHMAGVKDSIEPVHLDCVLERAPSITGKVVDERTGAPIANAVVSYSPGWIKSSTKSGPDGTFRVLAKPGKGWLLVRTDEPRVSAVERPPQGDIDQKEPLKEIQRMPARPYQAVVAVDFDPKKPKEYVITLDKGIDVPIELVDADGKPVVGAKALGLDPNDGSNKWPDPLRSHKVEATAFNPGWPRSFVFYQAERGLAAFWQPTKGDAGPWSIRLLPTATVKGRFVLPDGKPFANASLSVQFSYPDIDGQRGSIFEKFMNSDADGRFEIANVIGDVDYSIGYQVFQDKFGTVTGHSFKAKPSETKDLGDIKTREPRK
jgi:hypothetical protein